MFQKPKRCENCRFWRQQDPSDAIGDCTWEPERAPFWYPVIRKFHHDKPPTIALPYTSGEDCEAFMYEKHKPHPLDNARALIAKAQVGDALMMRTYTMGAINHAKAIVLRHTKNFAVVEMFNTHVRVRYDATARGERPGTVIEWPDWGVNTQLGIMPSTQYTRTERQELAGDMLRGVKIGDEVPLIGYPPMDGEKRIGIVRAINANKLTLSIGRRKVVMYRRGAMAGIIEGDIWTLDTTDARQAETSA